MNTSIRRRLSLTLLALTAGCATSLTPAERQTNAAAFDQMWQRVDETYYRPARLAEPSIDWPAVREAFGAKVASATTADAARAAMNAALARLGETHFAVVADRDGSASPASASGFVGLDLRQIGDGASAAIVVSQVEADSPADRAGVRAGWRLAAVDDDRVEAVVAGTKLDVIRTVERWTRTIAGDVGERHALTFVDERDWRRHVDLVSAPLPPGRLAKLGNLPAMDVRLAATTQPDGVGYFALSVFLDPPRVMPAFAAFVERHRTSPGIVIDLRGNPGGLGAMATGMCGFLVDRPGLRLGTMTTRDGAQQFIINPRVLHFDGPVAILVDEFSLSTSEILAGGLRDLGRARVFGRPTPGAALPSTVTRLVNGDLFQYAVADYVSAGGQRLEGVGVTPDEVVPLTRADLLTGRDRALEAATAWIESTRVATTTAPAMQP